MNILRLTIHIYDSLMIVILDFSVYKRKSKFPLEIPLFMVSTTMKNPILACYIYENKRFSILSCYYY